MLFKPLFQNLKSEYKKGGITHLVYSPLELIFIRLVRKSPLWSKTVVRRYYHWRASNDTCRYSCPPDRFKIVNVSPDKIIYQSKRKNPFFNRRKLFGSVKNGEWDQSNDRFNDSYTYKSLKQRFVEGKPWKETELVQIRLEKIRRNESPRLFETTDEVMNKCSEIDYLYKQICKEGYERQSNLVNDSGYNSGLFFDELDEVTVDVGRNGKLLFVDGRHRLSIAKILGLEKIPIVFLVRHRQWMEYRDELCKGDEPVPDHPDLRDLK